MARKQQGQQENDIHVSDSEQKLLENLKLSKDGEYKFYFP
jgi:hypothetical protein